MASALSKLVLKTLGGKNFSLISFRTFILVTKLTSHIHFSLCARWEKEPRARFARAGSDSSMRPKATPWQPAEALHQFASGEIYFKISQNFFRAIAFFNMAALGNLKRSVFRLRGSEASEAGTVASDTV